MIVETKRRRREDEKIEWIIRREGFVGEKEEKFVFWVLSRFWFRWWYLSIISINREVSRKIINLRKCSKKEEKKEKEKKEKKIRKNRKIRRRWNWSTKRRNWIKILFFGY